MSKPVRRLELLFECALLRLRRTSEDRGMKIQALQRQCTEASQSDSLKNRKNCESSGKGRPVVWLLYICKTIVTVIH